ncbi:MAG TPA: hypothetical protein VGL59_13760, partial [Polyangia bacterium]
IDTWVFLVPGLPDALRLPLVLHTEFVFFLATLAAVVATVRWLLPATPAPHGNAWAAFFLFPSIFVYDSNLGGAADHLAAFFVLPLFLLLARAANTFSPRLFALGGGLAGAALITKYQTAYVTAPLLGFVAIRAAGQWLRPAATHTFSRRRLAVGLAALAASAILTASPYFLENFIFYGNPVYPFMQAAFTHSRPTFADAPFLVSHILTPDGLRGAGSGIASRVLSALQLVFTFSFQPHYSFLNDRRYFGFLFTLLAPLSLLLPDARRLRTAALIACAALFCWALNYLVDRNLQIILPLMVAVTAGVFIRVWRLGGVARLGLVPLCLAQVFWGGDLFFQGALQGHIDQIRGHLTTSTNNRETSERRAITNTLPFDAKVVVHDEHLTLGLDRETLSDQAGFQGLIDYHPLRSAREAFDRFRSLGVTHVLWIDSAPWQYPLQRDIVFTALIKPLPFTTHGRYKLAALPAIPPPATPPYRVLRLGVPPLPDGIYAIDDMSRCELRPPGCEPPAPSIAVTAKSPLATLFRSGADVVVRAPAYVLDPAAAAALTETFTLAHTTSDYLIYLPH